jgi:hypothetical protein
MNTNCGCPNQLQDAAAREDLKKFYEAKEMSFMDKVIGNPAATASGIALGGLLTFGILKLSKRIK